jgi:transposase
MSSVPVSVGLDYHDETIRVCVLSQEGDVLGNRDVPNDVGAVQREVLRLGRPGGVAIEACCGAADFAAELIARTGWTVRLAHAGYVRGLRRGPDKTDCGDARLLADLVRTNHVPEVWLADETTRQLRRLVRYREGVKAERKDVKLRIRAVLREERVPGRSANPWTRAWLDWVRTVPLGEHSRWVVDRLLDHLARLEEEVAAAERRMAEATADDPIVQGLLEQPAVGPVTAVALRAEVGRFDRFGTGKQLSRFCGVTPCNASSGKRRADAGMIRAGNAQLRALLIQLAQRLPRCDPHFREMKRRLCRTKPANVATCALANRWLRRLFHRMQFDEAPLPDAA